MAPVAKTPPVPGSSRAMRPGAQAVGPTAPTERIEVTVKVRPRPGAGGLPTADSLGTVPPKDRQYMSRQELVASHGADPADMAKVEAFAHQHGLEVVESEASKRRVVLAGTAQEMSAAFAVQLIDYEHPDGNFRGRVGAVHVPDDLHDIVQGVFGLDDRRQARPHFVPPPPPQPGIALAVAPPTSYTPPQVADLYKFPAGLDGHGQCVGIVEFGGGFQAADLQAYFHGLGLATPQISVVSVDHVTNSPGSQEDGEVALDIEIVGAVAPGASIVVYFAPFTERGWVDVLTTAIHDNQNKPSVISISWGWPEGQDIWTATAVNAVNQVLQEAAAIGVTVICASGDDGSNDEVGDGQAHVDFPASSPFILSCGGTTLKSSNNKISSEVVWNRGPRMPQSGGASGGGVSNMFALPAWQAGANVPHSVNQGGNTGRGVPDIAGDADGNTGYIIRLGGRTQGGWGGTSAVAPLVAALIARINQKLGQPVGYFNPLLYTQLAGKKVFRDVRKGTNDTTGQIGGYPAGAGWDACTGWGSPNGTKLLKALGG